MYRVGVCLVLLMIIGGADEANAGAWGKARGQYYGKVSGIFYDASDIYNDMGKRTPMGLDRDRFYSRQTFIYGEYGLGHRLTFTGQVGAGQLVSEDQLVERITWGLGDVQMGLKYQLGDGSLVFSPAIALKIPTGYDASYVPALGTGDPDMAIRLLSGLSLYPLPLYAGAEAGYTVRGGPFSNQWSYLFEVGATPHARLFTKLFVAGVNTQSAAVVDIGLVGMVQVSEGDFAKVGFNAAVQVSGPLWVDVLWEGIFRGENIGAGSSWGLGVALIR